MSTPHFAKLIEADIREAWEHEARFFTPWLAENIDHIAEALGLKLEVEGTEVSVEGFSADILARDLSNDSLVLIENQLELSDHKHLGQIITYLAGLRAKTIVWIAANFHPAHLSAFKWLNENTESDLAFFAVRVKAVRIGVSPFAPVFQVLERPNVWERQIHSAVVSNTSPLSEQRLEFWQAFVERVPSEVEKAGPAKSGSNRWHNVGDTGLVVSIYYSKDGVGLFIRGERGVSWDATNRILASRRKRLDSLLPVSYEESGSFYAQVKYGDHIDASQRNKMIDWLSEQADLYEQVILELF